MSDIFTDIITRRKKRKMAEATFKSLTDRRLWLNIDTFNCICIVLEKNESQPGFPTMPEMPATRPDEFYADQHVIGHIRLLSSWQISQYSCRQSHTSGVILCWFSDQRVRVRLVCAYIAGVQ